MESFSNSVLLWIFGRWIFDQGSLPPELDGVAEVTPIVILASIFSTAGLAMVGILGGWSAFLGIFRLRQNGNFFGSRDSNEAFFYPMRLIAAMLLCAPVINVATAEGETIFLTPGHALIVGVAKSGSAWADDAQGRMFRLMHRFNMFKDPSFLAKIDDEKARALIASWYSVAAQIEAYKRFKNPYGLHTETPIDQFSQMLIEAKWRLVYPDGELALAGTSDEFAKKLVETFDIALIPPNDELAKRSNSDTAASFVTNDVVDATTESDMETEGIFCRLGAKVLCSDEYEAVRKQNAAAIRAATASAQRDVFAGLLAAARGYIMATEGPEDSLSTPGLSGDEMIAYESQQKIYIIELTNWYKNTVMNTARNLIASEHIASAEVFYTELENWGWMASSAFVLRAAADFSRLQSYADGATSALLPQSDLHILTGGDVQTKSVHMGAIKNISQAKEASNKSLLQEFLSLEFLKNPETFNISKASAWGRSLVGAGVGMVGGSYLSGFISKLSALKPLGVLDNSLVKTIGFIFIAAGGCLGYILPLMFVMQGAYGVISWITFVIQAFFGVTPWAAAQAAPKGEEHSSQMAAKGWNIIIFILLYPVLAVGGLAAAIVVTNIALPLAALMATAMFGLFDPGTAELGKPLEAIAAMLIGGLATAIAFVVMCWSFCVTSAQLITGFPRTVLNMVSFGEPALNPYENASQGVASGITRSLQHSITAPLVGQMNTGISRIIGGKAENIGTRSSGI